MEEEYDSAEYLEEYDRGYAGYPDYAPHMGSSQAYIDGYNDAENDIGEQDELL